jgi:hypothetical protein
MNTIVLAALLALLAAPAVAQTTDTLGVLKQIKAPGEKAAARIPPEPGASKIVRVAPGASIQDAINAATPGTTVALKAGARYIQSVTIPKTSTGVRLTTEGCALGNRPVLKTDLPVMATLQGAPQQSFGLWVMGDDATVDCINFGPNPNGNGEMLRLGDAGSNVLGNVPRRLTIRQNYFKGDPGLVFGQKRGIAANSADSLIELNLFEDIWVNGQDSQCIAIFSTPGNIIVRRNVGACASENFLIGGVPPAGPDFVPSDILVEYNVFTKPLKWKDISPSHVIKNLVEVKIGRRVTIRRNWLQRNWQAGQDGFGFLATLRTNGPCPYCELRDVLFEENIIMDVGAGVQIQGWEYVPPGSGQFVGVTIRRNLFVISKAAWGGNGRPFVISNEPKGVVWDANTIIHDGNAFISADWGAKVPVQQPPLTASIKAGPVEGLVYVNNLVVNGDYGIFTPAGSLGVAVATYFPNAVIGGNVIADAPAASVTKYNAFAGSAGANIGVTRAVFNAAFDAKYCQTAWPGKGADCTALPWELQPLVPPGQ